MARKMKDSGIAWIGEIPEEWQVVKVKHNFTSHKEIVGNFAGDYERLALTLNGVIKRSKDDSTGLQPEVFTGYQILRKNELVFKLIDLANVQTSRVGYSPYLGIVSPAYIILHPNQENESKYGEYFFLSMWQREIFNHIGDDGVRSSLNVSDLRNIPYLAIPIQEKKEIAAFLDEKCAHIDAVIEKTRASIDEYKKLKQAIITRAVTKGLRQGRKMKDSGIEWIGEIPEEWDICYVSRLVKNTQNGLTRRDFGKSDGNIVLKLKNITKDGNIDYEFQNRIQLTNREKEIYRLQEGDFLFVRVNGSKDLVGKNAIFKDIGEIVAFNDHIIRVKINDQICDLNYFHWYLLSSCGKSQIELHTATAAGQYTINSEGIKDIRILIPELSEQQEIAAYLDAKTAAIDRLIAKKEQLIAEMQSCKKSLIYEVVTGKRAIH